MAQDWFDNLNNPYSGASSGWDASMQANAPALLALYQRYYGTSTPPVDAFNAALGNPGGMAAVEAMMAADPNSLPNQGRSAATPPTATTGAAATPAGPGTAAPAASDTRPAGSYGHTPPPGTTPDGSAIVAPGVNPYTGQTSGLPAADQANASALLGLYEKYYGTSTPPLADFNANLGNPGGMAAVEAMMKADPNNVQNRLAAALQPKPGDANTPQNAVAAAQAAAPVAPITAFPPPPPYQGLPPLSLPQMAAPTPYALPTAADVAQMPGYQFTLQQGIRNTETSDIARGTGLGGQALKDLAQYTTGLADTTYGNRVAQTMAANNQNFSQNLATNQFNAGAQSTQYGQNLQNLGQTFQNTYVPYTFGQTYNMALNNQLYNQYRGSQNDAFSNWLALALLGNQTNQFTFS
jgi:hypothetical protein